MAKEKKYDKITKYIAAKYYYSLKKNHLLEKDLSASIKFIVFFVQGLPGSLGEKGEKGDSAGDVVGAKVSQMMVPVLSFVHH